MRGTRRGRRTSITLSFRRKPVSSVYLPTTSRRGRTRRSAPYECTPHLPPGRCFGVRWLAIAFPALACLRVDRFGSCYQACARRGRRISTRPATARRNTYSTSLLLMGLAPGALTSCPRNTRAACNQCTLLSLPNLPAVGGWLLCQVRKLIDSGVHLQAIRYTRGGKIDLNRCLFTGANEFDIARAPADDRAICVIGDDHHLHVF